MGVGARAQVMGGRRREEGGHRSLTREKDRMGLLANAGVKILAERGGSHLFPWKFTVEPKAAFPLLAGLPDPAPTSSHSVCRDAPVPGPRGSLCTSSPLCISRGGRLRLPRPQGAFSCTFPPQTRPGAPCSTAHLATAAARAHGPPELPQASGPSRGWGFGPPPLFAFVAAPPGHPLSVSASASASGGPEERGVRAAPGRTRAPQSEGRGGPSRAASRGGRCCRRGGEGGGAGGQAVGEGGVLRGGERRSDFLGGCRAAELPPSLRARCGRPAPRLPDTRTGPW